MGSVQHAEIPAILAAGLDLSLATVGPDGAPHATVVSYASEGETLYFGCSPASRKAANLANDNRVAATITLPYRRWGEIRGLSLTGKAECVANPEEAARIGLLFLEKFPETAQYVATDAPPRLFRLAPEVVQVLDYRKGFGHTDRVDMAPAR